MQFIQCDDLVESAAADAVERLMLSDKLPWHFYANVNYSTPPPDGHPGVFGADPRFQDSHGFGSLIFPGNEPNSPWFEQARRLLEAFLNRHGLTPTRLLRVKANLLVRAAGPDAPRPFTPHVDIPKPHWAMIYYVNDSDGDTLILDKTYPDWAGAAVVHAVSPKKGRAILFDGRHYHCGTRPARHDVRVVLNYNFL